MLASDFLSPRSDELLDYDSGYRFPVGTVVHSNQWWQEVILGIQGRDGSWKAKYNVNGLGEMTMYEMIMEFSDPMYMTDAKRLEYEAILMAT